MIEYNKNIEQNYSKTGCKCIFLIPYFEKQATFLKMFGFGFE